MTNRIMRKTADLIVFQQKFINILLKESNLQEVIDKEAVCSGTEVQVS